MGQPHGRGTGSHQGCLLLHGNQSIDELKRLIRSIANQDEATTDFSDLRIGNIVALELGKSFNWAKLEKG